LGVRYLFWDMKSSLLFATIVLVFVLSILMTVSSAYHHTVAVAIAPLIFLSFSIITEISAWIDGLYELKQTCSYTVHQITALRTVIYSIGGIIVAIVVSIGNSQSMYEFFSIFALCLSALFACAVLTLMSTRLFRSRRVFMLFGVLWVFTSTIGALITNLRHDGLWELALQRVPIIISTMAALTGAIVLIKQLSKMMKEGIANAHS